jgi:hypothetical protein
MQAALTGILHAIKNPHRGSVFLAIADNQRHILQCLDDSFHDHDPCEPATQPLSPSAQVVAPPPRVNDDAPVPRVDKCPVATASDTTTLQSTLSPRVVVNDNTDTQQRTRKAMLASDRANPHCSMDLSTLFAPSRARLCPAPRKQNLAPSSTAARKHAQCEQRSRKWDIHNPQLRLRLTTTQLLAWPTTPSSRNGPKQWTCAFAGCATGCDKGSSTSHGARALSTKPTVSANTILLHVIVTCNLRICTNCPLATATALAVCATTIPTLSPLLKAQCPQCFMPSSRPCTAVLRLQARVC